MSSASHSSFSSLMHQGSGRGGSSSSDSGGGVPVGSRRKRKSPSLALEQQIAQDKQVRMALANTCTLVKILDTTLSLYAEQLLPQMQRVVSFLQQQREASENGKGGQLNLSEQFEVRSVMHCE